MRMLFTAAAAALATAVLAMVAAPAGATTGAAMLTTEGVAGTGSNTAAQAGSTGANLSGPVFTLGSATVRCSDVDVKVTATTTDKLRTDVSYGPGCVLTVAGTTLGAATIETGCASTVNLGHATFSTTTGTATGGTLDFVCSTTLTVPSVGCTFHVTDQAEADEDEDGIRTQNVDTSGAGSTAATPWGMKLFATVDGVTYDAVGPTCFIQGEFTDGTYNSPLYLKNVWAML